MTTHKDTAGIIERLESASGPDRELDAEIALTLGIVKERQGNMFYGHKDFSCLVLESDYYDNGSHAPELWHYTSSIDAALSLVPEGWCVATLGNNGEAPDWWFCELRQGHRTSYKNVIITETRYDVQRPPNAAIALCIAALRARAHKGS